MAQDVQADLAFAMGARQRGDLQTALAYARKAIEADPTHAEARLAVGVILAEDGQSEEAETILRSLLKEQPRSLPALLSLSALLRDAGKTDDALNLAEKALASAPNEPQALINAALCYTPAGLGVQAIRLCERAIQMDASNPKAWVALSSALVQEHRLAEAERALRQAISLDAVNADFWLELANILIQRDLYEDAADAAARAAQAAPESAAVHAIWARTLTHADKADEAEAHVRKAAALDPEMSTSVGFWLQQSGKKGQAAEVLRAAIDRNPRDGMAYYGLVQAVKVTKDESSLIESMLRLASDPSLPYGDTAYVNYALGKALETLGEYERAMGHYDAANQALFDHEPGVNRFSPANYSAHVDHTMRVFSPEQIAKLAERASPIERPIFILGMIRSGSTLLEQIVASHPEVGGAGELHFWWEHGEAFERTRSAELTQEQAHHMAIKYDNLLQKRAPAKRFVTDKMPLNYAWLGMMHAALPQAKIIHLRRNPIDTCLSMYSTAFEVPPQFAYKREHLVFVYREYQRLMEHWRGAIRPDAMLEVDYEDLVSSGEPAIRRIIEFLGLPWDEACLHHDTNKRVVTTPSLWQARQPLYRTSMDRWRKFEPWLGAFAELGE